MDNDKYKNISEAIRGLCKASEQETAEITKFFTIEYLKKKRILSQRKQGV